MKLSGLPATSRRKAISACRCDGGSWWWRITAGTDPVTGRRRQPTQGGYATKAAAMADLDEYRAQLARGMYVLDQRKTVAVWLREWLAEGEKSSRWEPTTLVGYRSHVERLIIPIIGHVRLRDLQRSHIAAMLGKLAEPDPEATRTGKRYAGSVVEQRSPATINRIRCTLRSALTDAVADGLIATNPAEGRYRQIGRQVSAPSDWWQPAELLKFLEHAAVTRDPDLALWTVVAYTGLRRSEVCGLRWVDVDLTSPHPGLLVRQKCVSVAGRQACHVCGLMHQGRQLRGEGGDGRGSKSRAGDGRWVPLVKMAVTELSAHQAALAGRKDDLGDHWADHGLVFPADGPRDQDSPGVPRRPDAVTKRHGQLVREAGLRPIILHEMRHGAASLLAAAGMPAEQRRLILGHSTVEMTGRYTHGIHAALAEQAEAAADLLHGGS